MGLVGLGNDEDAARVLVETMHDAWARHAADARARHAADAREARPAMGDERIDQSAVDIAGTRMHDEAGRFVDYDDGIVLVDHIERNFLSLRMGAHRRRNPDLEAIPRFDRVFHVLYGRAAGRHVTLPDQSLEARAAQLRQTPA